MASSLDSLLDTLVVPGFSRIGYALRSRSFDALDDSVLIDKTVVLTGHTSGLGFAAARRLRSLGANLVLVGRDQARSNDAAARVEASQGSGSVDVLVADMGDLDQVARLGEVISGRYPAIDVMVHNAGALLKERSRTPQGHDLTVAAHVLGPFLLTKLSIDLLVRARGRVVTVSSGGMYAAALPDFGRGHGLELPDAKYDGTRQYAIAKRAQVTLNEMWALTLTDKVDFHAMHPGWADTPGVASSIPLFRALTRPILRTADQGADTVVWLAAANRDRLDTGGFWCDRERRPIHRLSSTKRSDTPEQRRRLWDTVESAALGSAS